MKIIEILTFAPSDQASAYDPRPLNDPDGFQQVSNALTGPQFIVDPIRLQPGVAWPGASVPDTGTMPVPSPSIGRDTYGSVSALSRNAAMQPGFAEPRRRMIPTRR